MKRFSLVLAMLVLALALGLAFVGCDDGATGGGGNNVDGGSNPFYGSWHVYDGADLLRLTFTNSSWTLNFPSKPQLGGDSGTYTYSGNRATLINPEGWTSIATISGNSLTYEENNPSYSSTMTFTKGPGVVR